MELQFRVHTSIGPFCARVLEDFLRRLVREAYHHVSIRVLHVKDEVGRELELAIEKDTAWRGGNVKMG